MNSRNTLYILVAAIALAIVMTLVTTRYILPQAQPLQRATVLPAPMELPEFLLQDQDGNAFTRESLRGQFSLLFFGFTNCPDICPATLQQLAVARGKLRESGADLPEIILVSVDPERDTPDVLKEYVGYFGADVTGVGGDIAEIRTLTSKLGIFFEHAEGEGDNYNVNHSAVVLVIDENSDFRALFSAPHDIDAIVNDVQVLMAAH